MKVRNQLTYSLTTQSLSRYVSAQLTFFVSNMIYRLHLTRLLLIMSLIKTSFLQTKDTSAVDVRFVPDVACQVQIICPFAGFHFIS